MVGEGRRKLWGELGICRTSSGDLHKGCSVWITHPIILPLYDKTVGKAHVHFRLSCVVCFNVQNTNLLPGELHRALLASSLLHSILPCTTMVQLLCGLVPGGECVKVSSESQLKAAEARSRQPIFRAMVL